MNIPFPKFCNPLEIEIQCPCALTSKETETNNISYQGFHISLPVMFHSIIYSLPTATQKLCNIYLKWCESTVLLSLKLAFIKQNLFEFTISRGFIQTQCMSVWRIVNRYPFQFLSDAFRLTFSRPWLPIFLFPYISFLVVQRDTLWNDWQFRRGCRKVVHQILSRPFTLLYPYRWRIQSLVAIFRVELWVLLD